eukprot:ANDGO_04646.mRNA.1 hypothetical protein EMIHUDRAFT_221672
MTRAHSTMRLQADKRVRMTKEEEEAGCCDHKDGDGDEDRSASGKSRSGNEMLRTMFPRGFTERHDLEQYFWTQDTVFRLMAAMAHETDCCCLAVPSLCHAWHLKGRDEPLLDIDTRFSYLPGFRYFDIRHPESTYDEHSSENAFRVIAFDPPFFYISMEQLFHAVCVIAKNDFRNTKLLVTFLKREEPLLLKTFAPFRLARTNFPVQYAAVKSNKWTNYALYSNIDLPGIRRIRSSKST